MDSRLITALATVYLLLGGLILGSFINLTADRLPRQESLVSPRSRCRACGRTLNAVDLVPVAGYLVRRGRCATCGVAIGAEAPLVETVAGVCAALPVMLLGVWPGVAIGLSLVALWGAAVTGRSAWRRRREPLGPPVAGSRSDKGSAHARRAR